ncbi:IS4 family transposase [Pleurocapsa sp. PCC 7319]|uniref:IS4 family transposase n=1 Tax=Pleurocapsa sp. PCC 7319 TaxID=118161 RepID=UPI000374DEC7|nr:IS4 family transposase [Pleurocapsa sp. PCC 7319]
MQSYRTIQIEKLAAVLPIPIKYESRRRHLQRLLISPKLKVKCLWFPVLKKWLKINQAANKIAYVAIDRTRWKERNLFVASLIKDKRAIPLHWLLLDKKGNSNFQEQKRLLKSVLRLLDGYQIVIVGDREFGHISLADWLERKECQYVIRTKDDKYIKQKGENYQLLKSLGLKPGKSFYLASVELTKQKGFGVVNIAGHWSQKTKKKQKDEGWYLITNLPNLKQAVLAYRHRSGIEAMFKDCKTGGYNLEQCYGNEQRLLALVLLIAIAYTCAIKRGKKIKSMGIQKYVCRLKLAMRTTKRHSNFWVGLYGGLWIQTYEFCHDLVEQLMIFTPNKLPFYQQGLRAKRLIQTTF